MKMFKNFFKNASILFSYWACRIFVCLAKVDIWNELELRIWKELSFMRTDTPKEMQLYLFHERKKGSILKSFAWPVIETFRGLSCILKICFIYFFSLCDFLLSWNWSSRRCRKSRKMHLNLSKSRATWGGRSRKQQKHQTPRASACSDFQLSCGERLLQVVSDLPLKRENNSIQLTLTEDEIFNSWDVWIKKTVP